MCMIAIMSTAGCEDEIFLIPENITGDTGTGCVHQTTLDNLLDGQSNYWCGATAQETVDYYFSSEVEVTGTFVQRLEGAASYFTIQDRDATLWTTSYFGDSTEQHDSVLLPFNNLLTDALRFIFVCDQCGVNKVALYRLEVYGCYITSTPTATPTSLKPTELPSLFPTRSPTKSPSTTHPTNTPSALPTTSPTESPSAAAAQDISREIRILLMTAIIVFLCGAVLFLHLRYRKVLRVININKALVREVSNVEILNIDENNTRRNNEDCRTDPAQTVDYQITLDKVNNRL